MWLSDNAGSGLLTDQVARILTHSADFHPVPNLRDIPMRRNRGHDSMDMARGGGGWVGVGGEVVFGYGRPGNWSSTQLV